ncbi:MAG TPA: hypothetical protein VFE32_14640 [Puia sp.]|jgi:hypothetical protein|nr:hypothetical protein [Puia sp.]
MKRQYLIVILIFISACNRPSPSKLEESKAPNVFYLIINERNDNNGQIYDIYLKDIAQIQTLNSYLKEKYNKDKNSWIQINYFNDSVIAKTYFAKQFDNSISEKAKDKLFKSYIANYKFNPTNGYDTLVLEH